MLIGKLVSSLVLNKPRLILTGLSGGAGKTNLTLGLARAWVNAGRKVRPFKKGPDYIDAVWLGLAAGSGTSNLDPFLMPEHALKSLFWDGVQGFDLGLVEGNRGLFDGKDVEGSCSTARLAGLLQIPVVLIIDCTKMTRTVAAIVAGCQNFEPGLKLSGVILNRTAGQRHRNILQKSIEAYTDVPVLGALPKIDPDPIPERHMGLVSNREFVGVDETLNFLARIVEESTDLDRLWQVAASAPSVTGRVEPLWPAARPEPKVTIGYVNDAALWFYYQENLDALRMAGAELVELSLLSPEAWPEIHGLYLGGGFPEVLAKALSGNAAVLNRIRDLAGAGLPIYAECGGFMYLGKSLAYADKTHSMAGVFEVGTRVCPKPMGLGYVEAEVVLENPFHPKGETLQGHEFHYSECYCECPESGPGEGDFCLRMQRGRGIRGNRDGLVFKNTFASYTHIHALGAPWWAPNFTAAAEAFQRKEQVPAAK